MKESLSGAQGAQNASFSPLRLLAAIVVSSVCLTGLSAQGNSANSPGKESERAAQVRALNNSALQLHGQLQENDSKAASIRGQAGRILAQRAAALQALIQDDAHAALAFAFSPELLADLAEKFPTSTSSLESHVTLSGTVEHWVKDSAGRSTARDSWFLDAGGTRLNLYFSTSQRPDPRTSPVVTIEGVQIGPHVAVSKVSATRATGSFLTNFQLPNLPIVERKVLFAVLLAGFLLVVTSKLRQASTLRRCGVIATALVFLAGNPGLTSAQSRCNTLGVQKTLVLLGLPSGSAPPVTPQQVQDIFFDTTSGHSLNGYWQESSFGQTSAAGDVYGWYTSPNSFTCDTVGQLFQETIGAAAAAGYNVQSYTRIFFVFPDFSPSCGFSGFSQVGCYNVAIPSGSVYASTSYIIANELVSRDQGVGLVAHEGGHQLGLMHAQSLSYGTQPLGAVGASGTIAEYGDWFSVMGSATLGLYSAQHRAETLGWMSNGVNYQTVSNAGTFTLQPLEANPSGLQALKVQRGTGNPDWLWLEYRQPLGNYDTSFSGPFNEVFSGALIHYEDAGTGARTRVLDFTPGDGSWYNPALAAGQSWTDPYTNISLSIPNASSSALTVSVNYGTVPCTSSAPTVTVSPLNPSIYPGQTASYAVSITNNDSTACAPSTVGVSSTEPSGWNTSLSSTTLNLGPGQSGTVTLGKGAPNGTPTGTYAVNLTASNSSSSTTDIANATVVTPPSASATLSVSGTTFTSRQSVTLSADVISGSSTVKGASVTFTIAKADGSSLTKTVLTNRSGVASWSYRIAQSDPRGTWVVSGQASVPATGSAAAQSIGTNTASFLVQ